MWRRPLVEETASGDYADNNIIRRTGLNKTKIQSSAESSAWVGSRYNVNLSPATAFPQGRCCLSIPQTPEKLHKRLYLFALLFLSETNQLTRDEERMISLATHLHHNFIVMDHVAQKNNVSWTICCTRQKNKK